MKSLLKPEEVEARRTFIGASEIPKLLGIGSPWEVWAEKRPDLLQREPGDDDDDEEEEDEPEENSEALERGNVLEAPVAHWAARRLGSSEARKVVAPLVLPENLGATPDYLICPPEGRRRLLEVKTAILRAGWGAEGTDEVPPKVLLQVTAQLGVARELREANEAHPVVCEGGAFELGDLDLESADVVRLDGRLHLALYRVEFNPLLWAKLRAAARAFWVRHVETGLPPPPGASDAAKAWLRRVFPAALSKELVEGGAEDEAKIARFNALKATIKPLEKELKSIGAELRERIGSTAGISVRGMSGVLFFENRKPSASWKLAAEELAGRLEAAGVGQTKAELLEAAREAALPEFGPRVMRWSSKLNKEGCSPEDLAALRRLTSGEEKP